MFLSYRKLLLSNDVHPNPGPTSNNNTEGKKPIRICHANVRSLLSELDSNYKRLGERPPKVIELESFVSENDISIMCVTETWCKTEHNNELVAINPLPKLFRRDRDDETVGGGLCLYASNDINISRLEDIEPEESEIMCFEYQLPNKINKYAFLCLCYRPQDRDIISFCTDLMELHDFTSDKGYYNVMFLGDFNSKNSTWCNSDRDTIEGRILKTLLDTNGYKQMVNFPTRFDIAQNRSSCLDFIITNETSFVNSIESFGPIANSDHIPVAFNITPNIPKLKCFKRHVWNFKKGDFDKLNRLLAEYSWNTIFTSDNISTIVDTWTDTFLKMAKECIPYSEILVRPSDLPYMNSELRSLIRRKDRLFKMWSRTLRDDYRGYYTNLRNITTAAMRKAQQDYISSECDKLGIDKNSRNWWQTVKNLCCFKRTSNTIAPIVNSDGIMVYDAETKADIFNEFYSSVSTIDNANDNIPSNNIETGPLLDSIHIIQGDVYEALTKLNTSKATGPDNIGNLLLKRCAPSISSVLTRIFNLSLTLGQFPDSWKIANITPLHKKSNVHDFRNYRPVSLLPCVSKVLEKLIFKEVYLHLRRNGLLCEYQSGFTPGDSTINQLIHITDRILKSLDDFEDCIGCFLDLTRAFDTVWHKGLLYKLDKYGIRDHINGSKTHTWFHSYLSNRGHRVSIDGKTSGIRHINAAVPQGSVLGPLLFLIYINDVTLGIDSDIFLFADDTSIFKSGKNNESLASVINSDLNKISLWAKRWKININPSKTVAMLFSKKVNPNKNFTIKLNQDIIGLSDHHKHLGLWLSHNLQWKKHIKESANKARQRLGCLSRYKYKLDRKSIEQCYITFIRPLLEYGNVLFDAANKEDLDVLSEIEKEALRTITGARRRSNIDAMYHEVSWPSLEQRRKDHKICILGKVIIKRFPNYLLQDLPTFYDNTRTVRNNTFAIPESDHDYYDKSFVPASIQLWNELPPEIRSIRSYKALKSKIKGISHIKIPEYYYYGKRTQNILHTKLRLGCSNLEADKFLIGLVPNDRCECDMNESETAKHFLLECGKNLVSKIKMMDTITDIIANKNAQIALNIDLLLYGSKHLSYKENCSVFEAVQLFIMESKRFK